jgi:hypothetical protein
MILNYVLSVQLDVLEVLESHLVIASVKESTARHLLKPHCLVVVDTHVVAAVFYEDVHNLGSLFNSPGFYSVHCTNCVDRTICLVEVSGFLK